LFASAPNGPLRDRVRRLAPTDVIVLERLRLLDGSGADPRDVNSIVIRGGRIAEVIGAEDRVIPSGLERAERISVGGAYVMPGLIDCHVHPTGAERDDSIEPYPWTRILRAARDAATLVSNGFTTVRHLGHGDPEHAYGVRDAIAQGLVAGPRMLVSGWAMSQTGGHGKWSPWPYDLVEYVRPRSAFCDGVDACRKFVRRAVGDGADCIKIYATEGVLTSPPRSSDIPNFSPAEIEAITDEAHRCGVRVAAHATGVEGARAAVLGGVDTVEHGPAVLDEDLLRLLVANGTSLVPTLSLFEWAASGGNGLPDWAAERARRALDGRRAVAKAALEMGVNVATGSDSGGTPRLGKNAAELGALVRAGLSPLEALRAATSGAARALGLEHEVGLIRPRYRADLLILDREPTTDVSVLLDASTIRKVFYAGDTKEDA
jgi:imidazolonepropionase-like amidohydrolase